MDLTELLMSLFLAAGCTPLAFFQGACPCCGIACAGCTSGVQPLQVQVVISGIANTAFCASCTDLDATYIIPAIAPSGSNCRWQTSFTSVCGFNFITLTAISGAPGRIELQLFKALGDTLLWMNSAAGSRDCDSWSSFNIPWNATDNICDNTSATCLLTTL